MKLKRIHNDQAENIIVNGSGRGFSQVKLVGRLVTIYHRIFNDKYYDIAEIPYYDDVNKKEIQIFYEFDKEEVKQLLGKDPEEIIRNDLKKEGVV